MSTTRHLSSDEFEALHYTLFGLFPETHTLAINPRLGTVSMMMVQQGRARMIGEVQLSASETAILLPLIEHFPYYAPYEVLLASFTYGKTTEAVIERCREHLQEAQNEGLWDQEMRPMRNVLSRARAKLRTLELDIASILETGYILQGMPARVRAKRAS